MNIFAIAALSATLAASSITIAHATTPTPAPASLSLAYTGITATKGNIMIALFDSEAAYQGDKPIRAIMVAADKPDVSTRLEGLVPGRYAIKSFHDIDGDGQMGSNPFGMPTEPFAFSNNAKGAMGPASWADAAFDVVAGKNMQTITIQ